MCVVETFLLAKYVYNHYSQLSHVSGYPIQTRGPPKLLSATMSCFCPLLSTSSPSPSTTCILCYGKPTSCCRGQTGQSAEDREWDQVEKERELKKAEVERARQELETRRRIEARLKAKQEAEAKSKGEGCVCGQGGVG